MFVPSRSRAALALAAFVVALLTALLVADPAAAQRRTGAPLPNKPDLGPLGESLNSNTIAIVSGNTNTTYLSIAYDLSAVLDDGDEFRVLPMIGMGGGQNIKDVRYLKGVDLGITQSAIMNAYKQSKELGVIDDKLVYIAKLFDEEVHLIVRADSGITMIDQLNGRKVNFGEVGSGTQLAVRDVFGKLEIAVQEVNVGQADGLEKLKNKEIVATILIAGKPEMSTARLRAADGFRILPVPYRKVLQADYLPATLTAADYPGLIQPNQTIDTIAVDAVLISYNWPKGSDRYRRTQKFVDAFFAKLPQFQKPPRHPKWKEANLAATIAGWKRFEGAEEWLRRQQQASPGNPQQAPPGGAQQRTQIDAFIAARSGNGSPPPENRDQLFREFMQWNSNRPGR
jgi:TRAP transporter TAXI family solute receptor